MLTIFTSLCILVFYLLHFTPNKSPFFFTCHRLKTEFITNVQQRGSAWNRSQKAKNSALSCASAARDHIHDWVTPKVDSPSSQIAFDHAELICFYILLFIYYFYFILLVINFCNFPFVCGIQGKWVSMGVHSGSHGIPKDIIYSFLVKCEKGKWSIVQGKFCGFYML